MIFYRADAISRNEIRQFIYKLKKFVGLETKMYFPIITFVENVLPLIIQDYQFDVVEIKEMGNKHGETYPSKSLIRIREDVYEGAINGRGRDRLTIAHEIGHLFLHDNDAIALCRLDPSEKLKPYENPEWQANAFGGELLASSYLIQGMSAEEVSTKCGVSLTAARVQLNALRKR